MRHHGSGGAPRAARSRLRWIAALGAVAWACSAQACASAQSVSRGGIPPVPPSDWTIPQGSVDAIFQRPNLVAEHPRMSGVYPRDLVMLAFRPGTPVARMREAVDAVGGTVVGGDGAHYFVRVTTRCADVPVWCAIDILEKLPQTEAVYPFMSGGKPGGSP